jgi:hypothetical protein
VLRLLPALVVIGGVVALIVWTLRLAGDSRRPPIGAAAPMAQGTAPAILAHGPDQGPGILRLTATQVVFTAATGRVVVIERLDIVGATVTTALPDRTTAAPVLAVTTGQEIYYFQVDRPRDWLRALT